MWPINLRIKSVMHYQMKQEERTKFLTNRKQSTTISVNTGNGYEKWLVSQIISGVQNKSRQETGLVGGVIILPTNGSRNKVTSVNRSSATKKRNDQQVMEELSVITYD